MSDRLIVRSFGPVKRLDIIFKTITVFVGDQGTGKSCVAKLFSIFKWLEKVLAMQRKKVEFYESHNRFSTMLCTYHRIESFIEEKTYIKFEGEKYIFEYENSEFHITDKGDELAALPKIMYIPAERSVLSVAENNNKMLKELPDSCDAFYDEFKEAKNNYKNGYDLPFGNLHYEYDRLNDVSKIVGSGYFKPVKLSHASSGIQSALPLCIVSDYLSDIVMNREEPKLSKGERDKMEKQVADIMSNKSYSENVKEMMLKQLSTLSQYGCFINITEEPELNLFPKSQMGVIRSLVKDNAKTPQNKLVITTHSPYILAIFNLLIMASKVYKKGDNEVKNQVNSIIPLEYHIDANDFIAYSLSENEDQYCHSIISENTGMIAKNDLDTISEIISKDFNDLYRLYGNAR